ncbi:sulfur transferase domain-containing protein [Marinicella sp. S1101]|uniref:beta-lactamase hydrolase domain-containing protein n=1 Tax=Marinicella marina TaxID=2996016 RepID=UPI002260A787|nr:sulfur transferase domain-containing protein [Marinicella marina]MCX7553839.1 sulfur transferase domain-containing protein [Marinicella marina]MDJ1140915.1 sulfur transferase domain-containing protein [Marinicella marina]
MYKFVLLLGLFFAQITMAQEQEEAKNYLSKATQVGENVWIGPQPSEQDFNELAAEEIGAVINTRTAAEMADMPFKEVEQASQFNMNYDLLEIGEGHAYSPAKLSEFDQLMTANAGKKMLLHCRSGNRATQLYTAWLIKHQGKSAAEALQAVGSKSDELNDAVKALLGR